jgi:hypothetical protein
MKMLPTLSTLPELRDLDDAERAGVIRQWQRAADEPWAGYLFHVAFSLVVALFIAIVPLVAFARLRAPDLRNWVSPGLLAFGLILANVLYDRLILRRRRDLLHRVLEQRRNAP